MATSGCFFTGDSLDAGTPGNDAPVGKIQIRIADAPSDRIVVLALTLTSVKAISSTADEFELLSGPSSLEVTHLAATNQPLAVIDLPAGDYTQLEVTASGATVTYLDAASNLPVKTEFSDTHTITVDLSSTVTIGAEPIVVNIDVDVPNTVYLDLANRVVQVNSPVFEVSTQPVVAAGEQYPESGQVEHVVGLVTSVVGGSLTLTSGQSGQLLTFETDQNTVFEDIGLGSAEGAIVEVQGSSQSDGSLLASRVANLSSSNGAAVEGLITGYTGSGLLSLVAQDGNGTGMDETLLGANVALNVDGGTSYTIDAGGIDMTGLSLVFDENTIKPGQRVEVGSDGAIEPDPDGLASGLINANVIELQQQSLTGTVANYVAGGVPGTATFDLVLPPDENSYLSATNPGTSTVHVYQQSTTDVHALAGGIADDQAVQVRGLLFYSGSSASFALVAGRIKDAVILPSFISR